MALLRHTSNDLRNLDYNKIPFQKVQFLPIAFNGDVLFELPPMFPTIHMPLQMQGMDRKYDGHAWCKMITTNIKIVLGLVLGKLIARVNCDVCKTTMKTLCALAFAMKSSSAMSAHLFQSCVRWHCLHLLSPLHANFLIFLCVW
jgi:hypothetical protein